MNLTALPSDIKFFMNPKLLTLTQNKLTSIPLLVNCHTLTQLVLDKNAELSQLPASISLLVNLGMYNTVLPQVFFSRQKHFQN